MRNSLYLRTLGGLSVEAELGTGAMPSLGPRRMALLALVAAAGPRGISRDRAIDVLWANTEPEQARHTLSQMLYSLRRDLCRDVIAGGTQLRFSAALRSDVGEFHEALSAGDAERAAALYTGPFLDGFYLPGAPEFERWCEETRTQVHFALVRMLEKKATYTATSHDFAAAQRWWERLGQLDPLNAQYAAGSMRALMALGDHTAALRVGRQYESRVLTELELEPDPGIRELMATLRTSAPSSPPVLALPAPPAGSNRQEPVPAATRAEPAVGRRPQRTYWLAAVLAAVVLGGGMLWRLRDRAAAGATPMLAVGTIQSRDSAGLGPMMRDLLATNLGRLDGIRVVSNTRLLELTAASESTATATAAARAGATELLEGELAVTGSGLVLTLRRVAVASGVVLQGYTVRAADVLALTDSATGVLAADLSLAPPDQAAIARTRSTVAYALYEQGLRAFYSGDYATASQLMHAALGRDSTFAMAAAYVWRTSVASSRFDDARRELPTVQRLASRATERERLLIETLIANFGGAPLTDLLASARRLTRAYPEEPDGHLLLGQALWDAGDWVGAVEAFNRVTAIDSAAGAAGAAYCRVCTAIAGAVDSYMWADSAAAAERTARRLIALRPADATGWGLLVEPLLRLGRRAEAEAANSRAARLAGAAQANYHALDRDLIRSGRLDELETRYLAEIETTPPELLGELPWLLAFVLRNQGRFREATELAATGRVASSSRRLPDSFGLVTLAVTALEAGRPREAGRRFLAMVGRDRARDEGPGFIARSVAWHMTLAATAFAAAGDTARTRTLADSVRRIGPHSSIGRDVKLPYFIDGLLLQRQNRNADAVDAFRRSVLSLTDGYTRINLELARSLSALQRHEEAIAVLQPALRGGVDGSNSYVTHTELHEALAHAFHGAGQRDSAAAHYAAVARAWRRADPQFHERFELARERAATPR